MEIRYASHPEEAKHYTTERLRKEFLVENLFQSGEMQFVYTHHDRVIVGGAVPTAEALLLSTEPALHTEYFLERRELGIINIGAAGVVVVDGQTFELNTRDCLYVGLGNREVQFQSNNPEHPAKFYLVSSLAHHPYPTQKLSIDQAEPQHLGSAAESNQRTIYRYVHAGGIQSCQLMLGMTLLDPNNMWNTMPAHLHDRRMEVYLYFDMNESARVFHLMGEPNETRHLVVQNEQVVISPSWSIHSGVGTSNYTFIWAMAGENYTFQDMDAVSMENLR